MSAILLALGAALAYGASDFLGGRASTRAHFAVVSTVAAGTALLIALVAAPLVGGTLSGRPLVWGTLSGVGSGMGTLFLYRGLARARVAVVAPTSGVLAAALPSAVAIALGERPAPLAVVGLVLALPAVWLISGGGSDRSSASDGSPDGSSDFSGSDGSPGAGRLRRPSGVIDGVLAGFGFGLLFLALDRAGDSAGLWPLATGQAVAFVLVGVIALRMLHSLRESGAVSVPAPEAVATPAPRAGVWSWWHLAVATGGLGSVATLLFYASTTSGLLTIAAVLTSLYPAGTIVLARLVLDERISRRQALGLALAGVAVVLITLG